MATPSLHRENHAPVGVHELGRLTGSLQGKAAAAAETVSEGSILPALQ